jgi:transcriptional regulator with XRE-family HTH domain
MYNVIWELRTAHGYTLRRLEELSGVSKTEINNIENGKINPTVATLRLLAAALGVELTELLKV